MKLKHTAGVLALALFTLSGASAIAAEMPVAQQEASVTSELTVNINTADEETLADLLNGIGEARARAIIEYREANGPFRSAADLEAVSGVGERIVERNLAVIRVQ